MGVQKKKKKCTTSQVVVENEAVRLTNWLLLRLRGVYTSKREIERRAGAAAADENVC